MITLDKFNCIKDNYGCYGSWAVWANQGERPKSNIGKEEPAGSRAKRGQFLILDFLRCFSALFWIPRWSALVLKNSPPSPLAKILR